MAGKGGAEGGINRLSPLLLRFLNGYTTHTDADLRGLNPQKRGGMAWNNRPSWNPRKRQPPSSKAELREMAEKAVASWNKPITRTSVQNTACPSCGYTESITVHWAKCPRCGARK